MRITRFAAALTLALAAAPTLMAAKRLTPERPVAQSARFTFTATVNGAYNLQTNQMGYWFAVVSGGTAPYTYYWYLDGWAVGGNGSSYSGYITSPGSHYIYVVVTDANGQYAYSNQFAINVY